MCQQKPKPIVSVEVRSIVTLCIGLLAWSATPATPATAGSTPCEIAWVQRPSGTHKLSAIDVDSAGSVYVTGSGPYGSAFPDFVTLKCDADGNVLWNRRFNGPYNGRDIPIALRADAAGNTYVTGYSRTRGSHSTNVYMTLKYDPDGNLLWTRPFYAGSAPDCRAIALGLDRTGDIYVTGVTAVQGHGYDIGTVKYSSAGNLLWWRNYDGPGQGDDKPSALAVDADGKVYVTGFCDSGPGTAFEREFTTLKYAPDGTLLWERRYDLPGGGWDEARSVKLDAAGHVYVLGQIGGECVTLKYDAAGTLLWAERYDGGTGISAVALGIDESGSAFVTGKGTVGTIPSTQTDYVTFKYNPDGALEWVRRFDGPAHKYDEPVDLNVDAYGSIYVTGTSEVGGHWEYDDEIGGPYYVPDFDIATVKYDSEGNTEWVQRYEPGGTSNQYARALKVDRALNVYIAGRVGSSPSGYAIIKYAQPLELTVDVMPAECPNTLNLRTMLDDPDPMPITAGPARLATDRGETVAVTVAGSPEGDVRDIEPSSVLLEGIAPVDYRYEDVMAQSVGESDCECAPPGADFITDLTLVYDRDDIAAALEPVVHGEWRTLSLTGHDNVGRRIRGADCVTILTDPPLAAGALSDGVEADRPLSNRPNPFNASTTVSFTLERDGFVELMVFDALGRRVCTLVNGHRSAGRHQVTWDGTDGDGRPVATGLYLYRLAAGGAASTKKMVLLR